MYLSPSQTNNKINKYLNVWTKGRPPALRTTIVSYATLLLPIDFGADFSIVSLIVLLGSVNSRPNQITNIIALIQCTLFKLDYVYDQRCALVDMLCLYWAMKIFRGKNLI